MGFLEVFEFEEQSDCFWTQLGIVSLLQFRFWGFQVPNLETKMLRENVDFDF